MPVLKVSEALDPKHAYSGMRLPVVSQPIDNCPQCGAGGYRDGLCVNSVCGFIDPRLEQAYQEYALATQVQNAAMADAAATAVGESGADQKKKASADGQTPSAIIDQFSPNSEKITKEKCKVCGNTSIVDGACETQGCFGSLPPKPFRTPESPATGINWKKFKLEGPDGIRLNIPRTFEVLNSSKAKKTTKSKKKVQATINRISAKQQQQVQLSPGMFLDSQMILPKQPVVRMQQALQLDATMQAEGALDSAGENNDTDKKTSEEL